MTLEIVPRRRHRHRGHRVVYAQPYPIYDYAPREVVVERSAPLTPSLRYRGLVKPGVYLYGVSVEDVCAQAGRLGKRVQLERLDVGGWAQLRCGCDSATPCR